MLFVTWSVGSHTSTGQTCSTTQAPWQVRRIVETALSNSHILYGTLSGCSDTHSKLHLPPRKNPWTECCMAMANVLISCRFFGLALCFAEAAGGHAHALLLTTPVRARLMSWQRCECGSQQSCPSAVSLRLPWRRAT